MVIIFVDNKCWKCIVTFFDNVFITSVDILYRFEMIALDIKYT